MENEDLEIEALEELIRLQRAKVDLLKKKRQEAATATSETDDNRKESETNATSTSIRETSGALSISSNTSKIISTAVNAINHALHDDDDIVKESEPTRDEEPESQHTRESEDSIRKKEGNSMLRGWWQSKSKKDQKNEERFVDALTRLSRLTTDLANERTYLAWIRTALAAARTVVSFLALSGSNLFGRVSVRTCVLGFAVLALVMMAHGAERYKKIKSILLTKDTPGGFARLSTVPLSLSLLSILALVLIVTSSDDVVN